MKRNDDTNMGSGQIPAYDDQGNPVSHEESTQEERDLLGLNQNEDDEQM
ncbi:hypothetical protein H0X10_01115 [Candidatus Saccharibacteria bacterium]|nr:hypothetical protein [Candidatus Saccharibacteria bacterium]